MASNQNVISFSEHFAFNDQRSSLIFKTSEIFRNFLEFFGIHKKLSTKITTKELAKLCLNKAACLSSTPLGDNWKKCNF